MFKPRIKKLEGDLSYLGYIRAQKASKIIQFKELSGKKVEDDFAFGLIADSLCDEKGELTTNVKEVSEEIDIVTTSELMDVILEFNRVKATKEETKADLKNAPKP